MPPTSAALPVVELDGAHWTDLSGLGDGTGAARIPVRPASDGERAVIERVAPDLDVDNLLRSHRPLAHMVAALVSGRASAVDPVARALGVEPAASSHVVGITGGIAAGKSLTTQVLQGLLEASFGLRADVVSTDGFLFTNHELAARGLTDRKGFPESYDHRRLISFLARVKAGEPEVGAPRYDHVTYDVVADGALVVDRPDVLLIEGLNVLQPPPGGAEDGQGSGDPHDALLVSDFLDLSIYVDAADDDLRAWFLHRLQRLRAESVGDPSSFYAGFASLSAEEFLAMGEAVWEGVNAPNLALHIAPTKYRADLIVDKAADHSVRQVKLRPW